MRRTTVSGKLWMCALAFALCCSHPLPEGAVQTVVERSHEGRRVIFVGLDGADWRLLDPFVADGTMPELGAVLQHAERRVLHTQHPPLSPLVWTSMMTGVSPLEHRILDFTRYSPVTREQEPITSDERATPAIWSMARAGGKSVAVFGLWATYPPEPGVLLTDRDLPRDYRAATRAVHRAAMDAIRARKPDLSIVYVQGTDEIGHFLAGDRNRAREYFREVDGMIGDYRRLAASLDAELVLASDHGFDWGGVHDQSPTATATAAKWHRDEGVWIRYPQPPATLGDARVAQVCATLLEILGLPPGEGIEPAMIPATGQSVNYRRFWRRAPARATPSTAAASEGVAKLRALGYLSSTAPAPATATTTRTPQSWNNEGLLLRESRRLDEAEGAFREALRLDPQYPSPRQNLDDLLSVRGLQRLRAHDCAGALKDFRGIARETALGWTAIAAAEGCLGKEEAANEAFARARKLDPHIEVDGLR